MFDRSLLPPAQFEFVVISDTHYLDINGQPIDEFKSRALQKDRIATVLQMVASLNPSLVIHLGDLVMLYPEREEYAEMMTGAMAQIEQNGVILRYVAGNCDVGDKPDPLVPTPPIQPHTLAWYQAHFGQSWYSFEYAGHHFVVLNAQLMNAPFVEADLQRQWLERDLAKHDGHRIFMFLHMPPYLWDEREPALGHYEIIDEPDRSWLLNLVRQYQVEILATGHVHFAFFDRIGPTRFYVLSSTSFGRDGFGYLFEDMPPERGRDDTPKLGFYLFRGFEDRTDLHFIRTNGATTPPNSGPNAPKQLITRTSGGLVKSPLGVTLKHLLTPTTATPIAWPSVVRRKIRNDYPLLSCVELGVKFIRVPWTDLTDPLQSQRLVILRDEGVQIVATSLWSDSFNLSEILAQHQDQVDEWEIQLSGILWPPSDCLEAIKASRNTFKIPITLSTIVPKQTIAEKYYPRSRFGYRVAELEALEQKLTEKNTRLNRVICRIDTDQNPWESVQAILELSALEHIGMVDFALELQASDQENANRVADALFAMTLMPGSRIYLEPLIDIDRMIDVNYGLLDTLCNPRPAFRVARSLNSILFDIWESNPEFNSVDNSNSTLVARTVASTDKTLSLLYSTNAVGDVHVQELLPDIAESTQITVYQLCQATSMITTLVQPKKLVDGNMSLEPILVVTSQA